MRDFVESETYRHIAVQNLALYAQRLGKHLAQHDPVVRVEAPQSDARDHTTTTFSLPKGEEFPPSPEGTLIY